MPPNDAAPELDIVQLFREHAGRVERVLRRAGVRDSELADATQEVFVVAHRKLPEFEGRSSVSTWLYRIALRVAAAERRRARHRRELLCDEPPPSASGDLRGELERRALLEHIADAMDRLSEAQRAALTLHDFEGLRMREVARRLRIPLKTAFSRSYAARKAIAEELRRLGYALPAWWPLWPGDLQRLLPKLGGTPRPLAFAPAHALWLALGMCVFTQTMALPKRAALPPMAAAPRTTFARVAAAPATRQAPPPSAAAPQPSRRRAPLRRVLDAPAVPEVAAADTPPPGFQIIHIGAEDLAPPREHPFAARLRESTPHVTPMAARLAPRTLEPALLETTYGAP